MELLRILMDESSQGSIHEQIEMLRESDHMLDFKIAYTWWILFAIIVGFQILNGVLAWSLDKRLKKAEKFMIAGQP